MVETQCTQRCHWPSISFDLWPSSGSSPSLQRGRSYGYVHKWRPTIFGLFWPPKGQLISKQNWRAVTSPKKRTKRAQDTILNPFFGRSYGSTILFRDLLTFSCLLTYLTRRLLPYNLRFFAPPPIVKSDVIYRRSLRNCGCSEYELSNYNLKLGLFNQK